MKVLLLLLAPALVVATSQAINGDSQNVCTMKGRVYTQERWYGYLLDKKFKREYARMNYQITYPYSECCANLLIYYDDQARQLDDSKTCEEREAILPPDNNQVVSLSKNCSLWNETGNAFYVCTGERIFRSTVSRRWFFAISRCGKAGPLNINYVFNITGFQGKCEEDPLSKDGSWDKFVHHLDGDSESSSQEDVYMYLSIALGILAGLAMIAAAVFFCMWFFYVRGANKGKGGSVTSSQVSVATMTQDDIFYVNPSLSDRENQDYSQTSSENYYEVIPERRSYESINTGLSNGGPHMRQLRAMHAGTLGHHHPHHFAPGNVHLAQLKEIRENQMMYPGDKDYPPPPYQMTVKHQLGHGPHHHHMSMPMQRQRPAVIHHAYHSSIVPTSAALNMHPSHSGTFSPIEAAPATALTAPMSIKNGNGSINNLNSNGMCNASVGHQLTGNPSSLVSFGLMSTGHSNISIPSSGLNMTAMEGGAMSMPLSTSANPSLPSTSSHVAQTLAAALSSASSAPGTASGQNETVA